MPTATHLNAADYGFTPGAANPSTALTSAINAAVSQGKPLFIEPGVYPVGNVQVSGRLEMFGVEGQVTLRMTSGSNAILRIVNAGGALIQGVTFDGDGLTPVDAYGVGHRAIVGAQRTGGAAMVVRFGRCKFLNAPAEVGQPSAGGYGVAARRCTLYVSDCVFSDLYAAAHGVDHEGFAFENNRVENMSNNGVTTTRSSGTPSFTRIDRNRINVIRVTDAASTGWQGNAINLTQESNITVTENEIYDCTFSSVRLNGCTRARVSQNHSDKNGEVAFYIEGFSTGRQVDNDGFDVVVSDNVINNAGVGVAIANIDQSGRLAVIANNVIRRITARSVAGGAYTSPGKAIAAEGCVLIANNFIEGAVRGVDVAAGSYTEDSIIACNVIRDTTLSMSVATTSGAKDVLVADNLAAGFAGVASGGGALRQVNAAGAVTGTTDLASFTESTATANLRIEGVVRRPAL